MACSVDNHNPINLRGESEVVSWQEAMKLAVRDMRRLLTLLNLKSEEVQGLENASFPVFVPLEYLSRIKKGSPTDPLLRQVLPIESENVDAAGFVTDPVADTRFEAAPGLLHKYPGRVLLITSGACGVHCRYCFRRHYPYQTAPKSLQQWQASLDYIQNNDTIVEVILSGGDPLTIVDSLLEELVQKIEEISHVKRLRIHTRMPVVIPQRVTREFCDMLNRSRLSKWIVLHINHPQEIDAQVADSVKRLQASGTTVLNQAVLLKGVNDTESALSELCERLVDIQVVPYYLNMLDQVAGAAHFMVPLSRGIELMQHLRETLPGYAVPRFVQDRANLEGDTLPKSKTSLL
ncbi:EF-P beta-lysylation protein EpmB [Pirellulaceae bacterium SH449]